MESLPRYRELIAPYVGSLATIASFPYHLSDLGHPAVLKRKDPVKGNSLFHHDDCLLVLEKTGGQSKSSLLVSDFVGI
jgi:hypothetical protein